MDSNSPYDIFTESLVNPDWKQEGKARAEEAVIVTPSDEVMEAFKALPPEEQDIVMSKLVASYHSDKIKMYLSWAQKYK